MVLRQYLKGLKILEENLRIPFFVFLKCQYLMNTLNKY